MQMYKATIVDNELPSIGEEYGILIPTFEY